MPVGPALLPEAQLGADGGRGARCAVPRAAAAARLQGLLEGGAELAVEVGVDERVEGRVEVADPEDRGDHHGRVRADLRPAQRSDDVPATVRQLAQTLAFHLQATNTALQFFFSEKRKGKSLTFL